MKFFFSLILLSSLLFSASIDSKIKKSKKALSSKKVEYKKMDRELSSVAKKIVTAKKEQKALTLRLTTLATKIKTNESKAKNLLVEDKKYSDSLTKIERIVAQKEKKFLDLVAKNFSLSLALEEIKKPTPDSVMMREAYKIYEEKNKEEMKGLKKEIVRLKQSVKQLKVKKKHIKQIIANYERERNEYETKKKKQDVLVKNLARDKAIYKKRFNKIKASRKSLERKLAKLNIIKRSKKEKIKKEKIAKAKRKKEREAVLAQTKKSKDKTTKNTTHNSKKYAATSKAQIGSYRGGKTISPLRGARLIKRFGTYVDPIYKFKIFNKSITLKAPHSGSKVRSVLAGKVVFAENSGGMLGKVVIIEHANKMHTIYAKLSRLAPGIHVGKQVSRATIIGKVSKSLMFEVTKNNKHINPLTLIRL